MTTPAGSGVTNKGTTYSDGSQVTSTNLNDIVDDAVFNTNAVDDSTIGLNSSTPKALFVKNAGIDTAQIKDDAVTSDKLADATLTFIKTALYPVGYVLTTINNYADSAAVVTAFGGTTWVRFGAGRALVGYDASDTDFDSAEETGGAKTHTLAIGEIPNATGRFETIRANVPFANGVFSTANNSRGNGNSTEGGDSGSTVNFDLGGGGGSHNNLQPYIVVYMWKRTA